MRIGLDEPEAFWFPAFAARFGIHPWDMPRIRIDHMDAMTKYLRDVPLVTL